jgi:hypothetical protein
VQDDRNNTVFIDADGGAAYCGGEIVPLSMDSKNDLDVCSRRMIWYFIEQVNDYIMKGEEG